MTMILDDSMVTRAENDYAKIAKISAIGSLADTVLRELIDIETGDAGTPLVGIPLAARIFRDASAAVGRPRSIWDAPSATDELLRFTGNSSTAVTSGGSSTHVDLRPWLDTVAEALEESASSAPSEESLSVVRREFTQIANETMRSAARIVRSRYSTA